MGDHKGLLFIIFGFVSKIIALFAPSHIALTLSYLGTLATSFAIIYYCNMFYKWFNRNFIK